MVAKTNEQFFNHWRQVSARVNSELTKRAEQFGLILDDISITHLTFGREFTAAVELKQVAQQEAEKARSGNSYLFYVCNIILSTLVSV